jgi:hypothetical protein
MYGLKMTDLIYPGSAANTYPKPKEVYEFMRSFYPLCGGNPGRSGHDMAFKKPHFVRDCDPVAVLELFPR